MPELPEVETIRKQLSQVLLGQTVESVEIITPKSFQGNTDEIKGEKIINLERKGKILIIHLSQNLALTIHLKMTGQLLYCPPKMSHNIQGSHTRVILNLKNDAKIYFNDLRKFGWMKIVTQTELHKMIKKLGPDPLNQTNINSFRNILSSSKKPVKLLLMDQEKIAGVGNIYANEALFLSKIHPKTASSAISVKNAAILLTNLKKVLLDGIKYKGSSRTNFLDIYGVKGSMQEHFLVYNQENKPCPNNCGSKIKRIKLTGRSSFFCPRCQLL